MEENLARGKVFILIHFSTLSLSLSRVRAREALLIYVQSYFYDGRAFETRRRADRCRRLREQKQRVCRARERDATDVGKLRG